jgi:anion-transporting  ArsA/GET3 family ATPase
MRLSELLSKKLLFVSGKGGVGKTTVSLALALAAAETGKKVILVEINSDEQVAHVLKRSPIGYQEVELLPRLWGINIKPQETFREYVLTQIKVKSLYRAVFGNKLVKNFIEGTPGLPDLMCVGKIATLLSRYDLVIVDAPATGHSIALLQIASIVTSAVKVGPLNTQAEKINKILHDPKQTMMTCVSLPEEMPITETIEMVSWLKNKLNVRVGPIFLNQTTQPPFSSAEWKQIQEVVPHSLKLQMKRGRQSKQYVDRLKRRLPKKTVIQLPFIYSSSFGLTEIEQIAQEIH